MLQTTFCVLLGAMIILLFPLFKAPTVWHRLVPLNLINIKLALLITVFGVWINQPSLLDISITYSIIGFMSMTLISRFLLKGGRLK